MCCGRPARSIVGPGRRLAGSVTRLARVFLRCGQTVSTVVIAGSAPTHGPKARRISDCQCRSACRGARRRLPAHLPDRTNQTTPRTSHPLGCSAVVSPQLRGCGSGRSLISMAAAPRGPALPNGTVAQRISLRRTSPVFMASIENSSTWQHSSRRRLYRPRSSNARTEIAWKRGGFADTQASASSFRHTGLST